MRRHFDAVQASLASLHSAQQTPHLLRNLAQAVRNHFEMEEVDGIYEQVQRDAPHLASEVHKLEADHQVLLEEIAELADMGQGLVDDAWVRQVSHLFRRFRDRMAHHEAEENKVVQRAYSDDVGTKD